MSDRYEGSIEVGTEWELRGMEPDRGKVIRLVGPEDFLEGGWLYECVTVNGSRATGSKKKRISDDILRAIYKPIEGKGQ